jgi:hypothetical protein
MKNHEKNHEENLVKKYKEAEEVVEEIKRIIYSPLDILREKHDLPVLPKCTLKSFSVDKTIDAKRNLDLFLDVCDLHCVEHDDVMVRLFLQTLLG